MIRAAPAFVLALLCLPHIVFADIRISEVMYDEDGTDTKREWIELHNTGNDSIDISKWKFIDKTNHVLNAPPKNGGTGSLTVPAGGYAILAADAATFLAEYPGVAIVIDTVMSLNNAGASISIADGSTVVDTLTYTKALGASDTGESLQLHEHTWVHAKPTPGRENATESAKPVARSAPATQYNGSPKAKVEFAKAEAVTNDANEANDPLAVVNSQPEDASAQVAAVGTLAGGSVWWFAALALALGTGAAATLISHAKKEEWDIEES